MSERKNSPFDILVLVFCAVLLSVGFGFIFYFAFVYVILPLAVEFIPALDAWLTRIGREHDYEEIYRTIRQTCALIAVVPAICGANVLVRRRMRLFIHETAGLITLREGLIYHIKNHLGYDVATVAVIVVAGLIVYFFDRGVGVSPFHILYCKLGVLPAIVISALIAGASQLLGIIYAQNYWRADYFFGD